MARPWASTSSFTLPAVPRSFFSKPFSTPDLPIRNPGEPDDGIVMDFRFIGGADIADDMRHGIAAIVTADGQDISLDARQIRSQDIDLRELLPGEVAGHDNGNVAALPAARGAISCVLYLAEPR